MSKQSDLEATLAFQIKVCGLPEPEREYKFHPTRKWRVDFAWAEVKIIVEVEGGTWHKSRHTSGQGFENDCEKYNEATRLGWRVYRFTSTMITSGKAIAFLEKVLGGEKCV